MLRALALAVLLALAFAGQASATFTPQPGQRPSTDPTVETLRLFAVDYWAARGVTMACDPVPIDEADALEHGALGLAWNPSQFEGTCRVAIRRVEVRWARWTARRADRRYRSRRKRDRAVRDARAARADVCGVILHELGHIGGLGLPHWDGSKWVDGHSKTGVMQASAIRPRVCRDEAKAAIRARPLRRSHARRP